MREGNCAIIISNVPKDLRRAIKQKALDENKTMSQLLREYLKASVEDPVVSLNKKRK